MPRRKRLDDDLKRDLNGKEISQLLSLAHLPKDYSTLTPTNQKKARLHTLQSWFDVQQPHILCTNVANYTAAHFLWVEFYMKPAEMNRGTYYFDDPTDKYDLMQLVMSPPKVSSEPSKSVVTATRRKGKTQTIIVEAMSMIPVVRPFSCCLLSEINDKRTKEELGKIKWQIEENDRIHADFGADGRLFPKSHRSTKSWEKHHLQFLHYPGCEVLAHSMGSAQRGRGPIYGVIDDPEDEDNTFNQEWRKTFFDKLLRVYVRMFTFGGKLCWVGTPIHASSCLSLAMDGLTENEEEDKDPVVDKRFIDWHRGRFPVIKRDGRGGFVTVQPQRMTVEAFHRLMEIDPIAAAAEILCEPVTPGTRAFRYDPLKHGFMHCKGKEDDYMLDLYTGETKPWSEFLSELLVFGAGDIADGQSEDADPGALIYIGINPQGVIYVLDAWMGRVFAEKQVRKAYELAIPLECSVFGWEKASLLCVVNRVIARREVREMRDRGESPPIFREIENAGKNKVRRILTMIGLFGKKEIRFLRFDRIRDPEGETHEPVEYGRESMYRSLLSQVLEYTDEGLRGHDDLIDALEMAIRLSAHRRGEIVEGKEVDKSDEVMEKLRESGLQITPQSIPPDRWTEKMEEEMRPQVLDPGMELVPYV